MPIFFNLKKNKKENTSSSLVVSVPSSMPTVSIAQPAAGLAASASLTPTATSNLSNDADTFRFDHQDSTNKSLYNNYYKNVNHKSSASSIAGTVGSFSSQALTYDDVSDDVSSVYHHQRAGSNCSNSSSAAPSISSSSIVSSASVLNRNINRYNSGGRDGGRNYGNSSGYHHKHRGASSVGGSTDHSSVYSTSQTNYNNANDEHDLPASSSVSSSSYHPYRR
jgi:hypothetical protein